MTTFQTGSRILVAMRREASFGVIATAAGTAQVVRLIGGNGLELQRAQIRSEEKRADGLLGQGRLGSKSVTGSFDGELSVGGAVDMAVESIMRAAWSTATNTTFASMTTVAVGSNTLTAAGGSWLTQGIRVGDIFYLTGTSEASNNSKNVRALGVTASVITVVTGTFTTVAASATGTLCALKKIYTAASPTRYSHTIEQLDQDITQSEQFTGCRLTGLRFSFRPGAMAKITYTFTGADRAKTAAAYFSNTVLTTSLPLVADDSAIRFNGVTVANFTGFDLDFPITARGEQLIGSLTTPDIFDNELAPTGTISALRSDFANLTLFDAETEFELSIRLQEPSGTPPNCFGIYLGATKISALSATPVAGGDGALTENLTLMIGPETAGTTKNGGIATFHSSGAAL